MTKKKKVFKKSINKGQKKTASLKATAQKKKTNQKKEPEGIWFKSIDEICHCFRVAKRSYVRNKGHPKYPIKNKHGYYGPDVKAFLELTGLLKSKNGLDKHQEEAKKIQVQRRLFEIKLARQQETLIPTDEYHRDLRELAEIFLRGLLDLKEQISTRIRDPKTAQIAEKIIRNIRKETAERIENA
jgi:hypothetical protein